MFEPAARPDVPRVAVVASDRRVRDSLASLLAATGRVEVIGLAADSPAPLRLPGTSRPDVILVDPALVGLADGALVGRLRHEVPGATILVVDWDDRSDPVLPRDADGVLRVGDLPDALLDHLTSAGWHTD